MRLGDNDFVCSKLAVFKFYVCCVKICHCEGVVSCCLRALFVSDVLISSPWSDISTSRWWREPIFWEAIAELRQKLRFP